MQALLVGTERAGKCGTLDYRPEHFAESTDKGMQRVSHSLS